MITAIISLGQVHGAEFWLAGWFVCAIIYFAGLLLNKANRRNAKNVLFLFLLAEVVTDFVWAVTYYDNSVYVNYGIGAVYGLILWPIALSIAGVIAVIRNKPDME